MTFDEYQKKSRETAIYPNQGENFVYPALGLAGETGEVADKIKKIIRDENIMSPKLVSEEKREDMAKELGDILWYLSQFASEFNLSLSDIAERNIEKLQSRKERGVLGGSGDNR